MSEEVLFTFIVFLYCLQMLFVLNYACALIQFQCYLKFWHTINHRCWLTITIFKTFWSQVKKVSASSHARLQMYIYESFSLKFGFMRSKCNFAFILFWIKKEVLFSIQLFEFFFWIFWKPNCFATNRKKRKTYYISLPLREEDWKYIFILALHLSMVSIILVFWKR